MGQESQDVRQRLNECAACGVSEYKAGEKGKSYLLSGRFACVRAKYGG